MWERWGRELPLWELSFELDPPEADRIDAAAWQIARAARTKETIYQSDFDGRETPAVVNVQPPEEMAKVQQQIAASWPKQKV